MAADGTRQLLPQSSQMQSFAFTPNNLGPRENQKNYVFVDEHNRHKRLKVMRACEGCRRRKIKCDAATTNTWPCSACLRLKLHCVPPTVNYDGGQGFESEGDQYESIGPDDTFHHQMSLQQQLSSQPRLPQQVYTQQMHYADPIGVYHPVSYAQPPAAQAHALQFQNMQGPTPLIETHYQSQNSFPITPMQQQPQQSAASPDSYQQEQYDQQALTELLGDLKMNEAGTAPYLNKKNNQSFPEEPVFEDVDEYKQALPPLTSGPDLKIRIPPELMPDEETALHYFEVYFMNVHPYVPVLNKTIFYRQWHSNRDAISPLILEAIFAIAGRLTDEPSQGQQWLALVGKHADSFMDVPRLSTLQAMLILLKARESAPKRGYYYRSWMTVVQLVAMAKDLGLDEHYEDHRTGRACGSTPADCITKTRIWQTLFVVELMIGASQGRTDLTVDVDTLDLTIPRSMSSEDSEYIVTRNFIYFVRCVRIVRRTNDAFGRVRREKRKDWGLDPEFASLNPSFETWLNDLPSDLQITFPPDGAAPWLPSHFIGNLHAYYHLAIIILHRPQLTFMDPSSLEWKQHMLICYSSAKFLCRIQEGVLQLFGLPGLLCMQRGINLTIYMILTCTVLHLVAMTSPDPDHSTDARDYFTRHMRILEKCSSSWPMPDMQQQIDALREAFSADTRKPFELKPSFPYGSPHGSVSTATPRMGQYHQQQSISRTSSMDQAFEQHHAPPTSQINYINHPMTPPISASSIDTKSDSPVAQSLVMMATGQRIQHQQHSIPSSHPTDDSSSWNPSRIFDQWNTTFGTAPSSLPQTTPPLQAQAPPLRSVPTGPQAQESNSLPELQPPSTGLSITSNTQSMQAQAYPAAPIPSFVSPSMWQESVASVYEGGLKRQWDYDGSQAMGQVSKRSR